MNEKLRAYAKFLLSENSKFNLTSFKNEEELIKVGIEPSLQAIEFIKKGKCLDIGSGSGIPAIPLAICDEENDWTLLEANHKKASFLLKCALELPLKIEIINQRAEEFLKDKENFFDTITVRQVKLTARLCKLVVNSLKQGGAFLIFTNKLNSLNYEDVLLKCGVEVLIKELKNKIVLLIANKI